MTENKQTVRVWRHGAQVDDVVAVESALELRVAGRPLAVTLCTPGNDVALGFGFLLAEGVIEQRDDVNAWQCDEVEQGRVVDFELSAPALDRWARRRVAREFRSTSACGACGKPSLEDLFITPLRSQGASAEPCDLNDKQLANWIAGLQVHQALFRATGGVHAAAALETSGACIAMFEDVGRHNALDKLVGAALIEPRSSNTVLDGLIVVSTGRAGFEIVQKALRARAAALCAIGAATSMAVELAEQGQLPLVAFAASDAPVRY